MKKLSADLISLAAVLCLGLLVALWYTELPDPMPSHWNMKGEVDGTMDREANLALLLGLPLFCWGLMKIIPLISPKGFRTETFSETVNVLQVALVIFMSAIGVAVMLEARNFGLDMTNYVLIAVGGLLIVLGNYLGKVRKNFFIGIRTPWTLASDEVWSKTHRLGGWMFVLAGLVLALSGVFGINEIVMAGTIIMAAVIPIVYSFILYQRIEGFGPDED
jgi:uncharacterized membrane protein